jgi:hypothetical protein
MKKLFMAMVIIGIFALICLPAFAEYNNTYYGQEGTANDYTEINAAGHGPSGTAGSIDNWKWQSGDSSWAGIYSWDGDAWLTISVSGDDGNLDVEADIEMYIAQTMTNHKMYFHIGNIFTAMAAGSATVRATEVSPSSMP